MGESEFPYRLTKRLTRSNGSGTAKVNIGRDVPFEAGDYVSIEMSRPDGTLAAAGVRKIMRSGSSKAVTVPKKWGFAIGEVVYITVERVGKETVNDSRREA